MRWLNDDNAALLVDLYELTMAASYLAQDMQDQVATFDLFVRKLPEERNFLVAAGLDDALHYLETLHFDAEAIGYLRSLETFDERFFDYLAGLRFSGEVAAAPEGEVVFAGEPLLRVTAPLIEAQIVETFLLSCIAFQTMIASKAARIAIACGDRSFVDFSARRTHGPGAALKVARAAYIGGADGTSNLLAASAWGIPPSGTMAHSYVMAFEDEADAFRRFATDLPGRATILLDTYDTVAAAHKVVALAAEGMPLQAVRLDSGDLGALAKEVRAVLDAGGLGHVRIVASSDLDEHVIAGLLVQGAPIDAFGVGTRLGTSSDAPSLGAVYKLAQLGDRPVRKLAAGKATLPGIKQVWRREQAGVPAGDVIALHDEPLPHDARPLLAPVMRGGRRLTPPEDPDTMRARCAEAVGMLPPHLRVLDGSSSPPYPVALSPGMRMLSDGPRD